MSTRVLITGGAGFVGAALVAHALQSGAEVALLLRPTSSRSRLLPYLKRCHVLSGDLAQIDSVSSELRAFQPERVFHLAWYAEPGLYLTAPQNLDSLAHSLTLLRLLTEMGCPQVIAVGTCAEYDTAYGLLRETTPLKPDTLYAAAKHSFHLLAEQLTNNSDTRFTWGRLFYLYGPHEDARRLIPALILALQRGIPFEATAGEQVRDYLYVADAVSALWALGEKRIPGAVNIASGLPLQLKELMLRIGALMGRPELVHLGARPYRPWEPMFICGENQHLRASTGWTPQFTLEHGLQELINLGDALHG